MTHARDGSTGADDRRARGARPAGAVASCCRRAAASATAASCSTRPARPTCCSTCRRFADPLTRGAALGHALGTDARRPGAGGRGARAGAAQRCRARPTSRTCSGCSATPSRRTGSSCRRPSARRRRAAARAGAARRPRGGADAEPEVGLVLGAARHRRDDRRRSRGSSGCGGRRRTVPGLTLAEPDYITLALRAGACARCRRWPAILDEQPARIENPDRKARFAVRPAGAVGRPGGARRVLRSAEGCRRRGSASRGCSRASATCTIPLRAAPSEKLHPARASSCCGRSSGPATSSFPKRWMDATLGGHSSAAAARMVARFLARAAGRLSRSPAARHPVVGGRSVSRERRSIGEDGDPGV